MYTQPSPRLLAVCLCALALPLFVAVNGCGLGVNASDAECVFDKDCDDDELCEGGECVRDDGDDGDEGEGEGNEGEGEGGNEGEGEGGNEGESEGGNEGEGEGEGDSREPGTACTCDGDCRGSGEGHAGACVLGVCMQVPSATCSAGGSTAECAAGFQCWGLADSDTGFCWPDCASFDCAGTCDADGSCAPDADTSCNESCSAFCGGNEGGEGEGEGECPPNSTFEPSDGFCYCDAGFIVVDNACVHECESNADCSGGDVCTDNSCAPPPCTATSCDDGFVCAASGSCVLDIGSPPPGPVPSCGSSVVPSFNCTGGEANCGVVVAFEPDEGPGYSDYALNGETMSNEYRSFIRRDVMMLIKYAAAATECLSQNWTTFGNGEPIGLGDMSESNGAIPGTSDGSPGHPAGTHEDGRDMDIGYFQLTAPDNHLRPICDHVSGGSDQYHCVSEPDELDVWRTALFIGKMHDSVQLRVIGVDGRAGPLIESAVDQLCDAGYLTGSACSGGLALAYETVDEGAGWFHFHHHHFHISLLSRPEAGLATFIPPPRGLGRFACLDEGCHTIVDVATDPRRRVYGMTPVNPWKRAH